MSDRFGMKPDEMMRMLSEFRMPAMPDMSGLADAQRRNLEALSNARVETLLLAASARREAWRCPSCGRAATRPGECPLDGTAMETVQGADVAVQLALGNGGTVRVFDHVDDLGPTEGIGALLRF